MQAEDFKGVAKNGDPRFEPHTTAQLKHDIDSGLTQDKVAMFDPAASPLGTDDEAGGAPADDERIMLAEATEENPVRYTDTQQKGGWTVYLMLTVLVGIGVMAAFWLLA